MSKNKASLENLLILSNDLAAYAEKWVAWTGRCDIMLSDIYSVLRGSKEERDKIPLLCKLGMPENCRGFAADF